MSSDGRNVRDTAHFLARIGTCKVGKMVAVRGIAHYSNPASTMLVRPGTDYAGDCAGLLSVTHDAQAGVRSTPETAQQAT
jgi:hypothetical protein